MSNNTINVLVNKINVRRGSKLAIAIDFGTSRSGCAFAFFGKKPEIGVLKHQNFVGANNIANKNTTQLLYEPGGNAVDWGFNAIERYCKLNKDEREKYHFFKSFKVLLHGDECKRDENGPYIMSKGKKFWVINLVVDYLKFLKQFIWNNIEALKQGHIK